MEFELLHQETFSDFVIHLVCISVGFLACTALLTVKNDNPSAAKVLLALVLVLILHRFNSAFILTTYTYHFPNLIYAVTVLHFLEGPLLFLFVQTLSGKPLVPAVEYKRYFLLCVLFIAILLPYYLQSGEAKLETLLEESANRVNGRPAQHGGFAFDLPKLTMRIGYFFIYLPLLVYYAIQSIKWLNQYQRKIFQQYSYFEGINLRWMQIICYLVIMHVVVKLLSILAFISFGIDVINMIEDSSLILFMFGVTLMTLQQPMVRRFRALAINDERHAAIRSDATTREGANIPDRAYWKKLEHHMHHNKPFKMAKLTLADLAEQLDMPAEHLSQVIKHYGDTHFFDFINRYRIEEAQHIIGDSANKKMSILDVSFDVGFNSKSSFYTQFKRHTGMTPTEHKNQAQPQ